MTTLLIAQDDRERPTVSKLVLGPEVHPGVCQAQFADARKHQTHPEGLSWLILWNSDKGVIDTSYVPSAAKPQKKATK